TSRLWKTADVYWRARRSVRRLTESAKGVARKMLGRPPADWAGPDQARAAVREAAPMAIENRHDVVCFPIIDWDFRFQRPQQLMKRFAEAGHRVFYIAQRFRSEGPPYEVTPKARNLFEVTLRGPDKNVYRDRLQRAGAAGLR